MPSFLRCPVGLLWAALLLPGVSCPGREIQEPLHYEVRFEGMDDRGLLRRLRGYSQAVTLQQRPPASLPLLERRAEGDVERFEAFLASEGYFGGAARFELRSDRRPLQLVYHLVRGPQYRLARVGVTVPDGAAPAGLDPALNINETVTTRLILQGEQRLVRQLRNHGHPFAEAGQREVVVDHARREVEVTYHLVPGPAAVFGDVQVSGLQRTREEAVLERMPWEEGTPFDQRLVETYRQDLMASGLFLTAQVNAAAELDPEGRLPVSVELRERKRRTLRLGLAFVSDIGFGASLDWEYRNFLRREVLLQTSVHYSEIELAYDIKLTRDRFLRPDLQLLVLTRFAEDSPDAYVSRNGETAVLLTRTFTERLRLTGGVALKVSEVEQGAATDNYTLLLSPWTADYNRSDDLLDPRTGNRTILEAAPYTDLRSGNLSFLRTFLEFRQFLTLRPVPGMTLAGRAVLGSIAGASRDDLPADERFYAGGGGSIRGYEYQSVGERLNGIPLGGDGLFETSMEVRFRFGERWGAVAFLDGGMAYAKSYPESDPPLQWGAGLGLRVFTGLGPVRLDVAVPVNPRENVDEDYQFYISLGQAF